MKTLRTFLKEVYAPGLHLAYAAAWFLALEGTLALAHGRWRDEGRLRITGTGAFADDLMEVYQRARTQDATYASAQATWQASRAYVYSVGKACDRADHARTLRKDAAGAILYAAENATWMAGEAIQVLGGNGYNNEYPTGRLWRDAKLYEIGAGTSEIRRMLIGRELFGETA